MTYKHPRRKSNQNIQIRITSLFLLIFVLSNSCKQQTSESKSSNIISLNEDLLLPNYFFDKGAWFGLMNATEHLGIATPLLLSDSMGYTLNEPLLKLQYYVNDKKLNFRVENQYLPGKLVQISSNKLCKLSQTSWFMNDETALISYNLENLTNQTLDLEIRLIFSSESSINEEDCIVIPGSKTNLLVNNSIAFVRSDSNLQKLNIRIPSYSNEIFHLSIQHLPKKENPSLIDFEQIDQSFSDNQARWKHYLEPYEEYSVPHQILAKKCIQTLINNWRTPRGEIKHAGLFPSYHQGYFNGFWAWDSWKHAVALVEFEPELAKDQVRAMFDYQDEYGMIADAIFPDTLLEKHNWRNTKPPLAAWAINEIFKATQDSDFVKEMFQPCYKYHNWWYENRDYDQNGLCEYGSTDGTRIAAAWESGMDNAVRFDSAKMIKNNDHAWSLNQESVELNAYLCFEKRILAHLTVVADIDDLGKALYGNSWSIEDSIRTRFYDEKSGYFYDYSTMENHLIKVIGPEAWTVLWTKTATQEQADKVVQTIMDSLHFNTFCPFPTLDASHSDFNPQNGYWRGPVWLDQAYFAIKGMRNYGYNNEANQMTEKLFQNAEGLLDKNVAIYENYHPTTGEGLNVQHFSWSAAHLLLLLKDLNKTAD